MKKNKEFTGELYSYLAENPPLLKDIYEKKVNELVLSQRQVESILGIERKSLQSILNKEAKRVDVSNLLKLGTFLNLGFEETIKIFAANLSPEQIKDIEKSRRLTFIANNFDLKNLKSIKFFESVNEFDQIEERIKQFFKLDNIFDYEKKIGAAFSRTKKSYNNKMLDFWVKSAFAYLEKLGNPNDYNRDKLKELIPLIKPYSRDVRKGLRTISRALYAVGVTVIFQPYLPTTQIRGATFIVNDKPCIVITNFNKNYATLWFALLHELYHVMFEFEIVGTNIFHLTGEPNLFLMDEDAANGFARQYFLSYEKSKYIYPFIHNKMLVERYAEQNQTHPSLIYNFYCYDQQKKGKNYWGAFSKYIPDSKLALKGINIDIWDNETLDQSVEEAKELIIK